MIVVRTLHFWGSGPDVPSALAACRREGGGRYLRSHGYVAHEIPDGSTPIIGQVDGSLAWEGPAGEAKLVEDKRTRRAFKEQKAPTRRVPTRRAS